MIAALLAAVLSADPPAKEPTPPDWVSWALTDLVQTPEADRPFIRYLAIPPWGNERWVPAITFALNSSVSQASSIIHPDVIAQGWMVRIDLRRFSPKKTTLAKTINTWDGLALIDPYLHVPKQNTRLEVAVLAPTVPQDQGVLLANLTLSPGAVYRADWFLSKALDTINGGVYYEFRQLPTEGKDDEKSLTEFDRYLRGRGIFLRATEEAGGERRTALSISDVTGKPRRADFGIGLGLGTYSITRDIQDGGQQSERHPLLNLIRGKEGDQGREVFVTLASGMIEYTLFAGDGKLVREAPPELVRDHNIPAPYTARLRPARSCIICHNIEKADGWREFPNDVLTVLKTGRFDVVSDLSKLEVTREEAIDKLASLYSFDDSVDGLVGRARRDYMAAVSRCVPAGIGFAADKSIVAQIGSQIRDILYAYDYQRIDRAQAAAELGYRFPDDFKGDPLASVLGKLDPSREISGISAYLESGVKINREDFESIYQDLLSRSQAANRKPRRRRMSGGLSLCC